MAEGDVLAAAEVADCDAAAGDFGERAVAAVGGGPGGAADGGGAVAPAGAEAAAGVGAQPAHRRRDSRRRAAVGRLAALERLARRVQFLKLDPFRRSSVSPFALALRDWSTWNTPAAKSPLWVAPLESRALVSRTVPLRVSSSDPTGIWRAWVIGTNRTPFSPGTDCAARAEPAGTATNT